MSTPSDHVRAIEEAVVAYATLIKRAKRQLDRDNVLVEFYRKQYYETEIEESCYHTNPGGAAKLRETADKLRSGEALVSSAEKKLALLCSWKREELDALLYARKRAMDKARTENRADKAPAPAAAVTSDSKDGEGSESSEDIAAE
ncbi:hypothetical protein Q8F55_001556 [Vanrija albida]|uniref:Uncharacterized protein n=1 Tax=Vanrija albida TaxID=181172 RepID=A0ABR3QGE3_9TREE